jgi:hypothetical protein
MDERHRDGDGTSDVGASAIMRKQDAWGKPILGVGDIVQSIPLRDDPGTVTKVLQVNANGAYVVAVKWFSWNNGRTTEEYITELELVSPAQ